MQFQIIQKALRFTGIFSFDTFKYGTILTMVINFYFISAYLNIIWPTFWFMFSSQKFIDYLNSFQFMLCGVYALVTYIIFLWKRNSYSQLFIDMVLLIEKSKKKIFFCFSSYWINNCLLLMKRFIFLYRKWGSNSEGILWKVHGNIWNNDKNSTYHIYWNGYTNVFHSECYIIFDKIHFIWWIDRYFFTIICGKVNFNRFRKDDVFFLYLFNILEKKFKYKK